MVLAKGLLGISLAAIWVALSPRLNTRFYRPMLFYPTPYPDDVADPPVLNDVSGEEIFFDGNFGQHLHGWMYRNPQAKYWILFSHGNAGNITIRTNMIALMLQSGASVFAYDYQSYGKSTGLPSIEGVCDDAVSAFDYLVKKQNVAANHIVVYGESLGAAISSYVSSVRQCAGIVLQSGFLSLNRIAQEVMPLLRVYPSWMFPKLNSLNVMKKPHPPLLIMHGTQDGLISSKHAQQLFANAIEPKKLVLFHNTKHADIATTEPEEYVRVLSEFLSQLNISIEANQANN